METMLSATAVTKLEDKKLILATTYNGLFMVQNRKWKQVLPEFQKRIRDLCSNGKMIYGVGDEGIFVRSMDGGENWSVQRFPTKATSWNVCSNADGKVIAHGDKTIYVSDNFGTTWETIRPFHCYDIDAPSIRSLFLFKHFLFIGTKIHAKYGGVWLFDLRRRKLRRIKRATNQMISALTLHNSYLVVASGSCRGKSGNISFCVMDEIMNHKKLNWKICQSEQKENSYLDLSADQQVLYTTSTKNKAGIGTICRVSLEKETITACGSIKGHGWRIVNEKENYVVAGSGESKVMHWEQRIV
ncbi:WD40/YVTN/BNR-like repeat-containing protein [Bacillus sp. C1]